MNSFKFIYKYSFDYNFRFPFHTPFSVGPVLRSDRLVKDLGGYKNFDMILTDASLLHIAQGAFTDHISSLSTK